MQQQRTKETQNTKMYVFETHYCLNRRSGETQTKVVTRGFFFVRSDVVMIGHGGCSPPAPDVPEAREMLQGSGMFLHLYQTQKRQS